MDGRAQELGAPCGVALVSGLSGSATLAASPTSTLPCTQLLFLLTGIPRAVPLDAPLLLPTYRFLCLDHPVGFVLISPCSPAPALVSVLIHFPVQPVSIQLSTSSMPVVPGAGILVQGRVAPCLQNHGYLFIFFFFPLNMEFLLLSRQEKRGLFYQEGSSEKKAPKKGKKCLSTPYHSGWVLPWRPANHDRLLYDSGQKHSYKTQENSPCW